MPKKMMKVQEPPKLATESARRWPKVVSSSMISLALRVTRDWMRRCAAWNWRCHEQEHVEPATSLRSKPERCHRGRLRSHDIVLKGDGGGLVFGLLEHGGESEEIAVLRLVHDDLLLVVVDGGEAGFAGADDVGVSSRFANFVDVL